MDRTTVQKSTNTQSCTRLSMHTISKKLAKQEKRARFRTSEREKYFGVRLLRGSVLKVTGKRYFADIIGLSSTTVT